MKDKMIVGMRMKLIQTMMKVLPHIDHLIIDSHLYIASKKKMSYRKCTRLTHLNKLHSCL